MIEEYINLHAQFMAIIFSVLSADSPEFVLRIL